ncbi:MAG: cation-transporting P-type ATPase [Hoeflea sp.]|uniref:cation-translocating P-type ATPase n=1 Tax=Hoeflea sp. TaxID=1940281 RepID=UPI001D747F07|nr:cation-transporting P-type ATPase [Hoeflea sp.]MBU4530937.1 cation-transporting P-type ATPase [Alphaproteobacteria bacterium]MBU4542712.1 cation-transporting P-type ATPase [Alphaproteobacteria bacterium]MBU4549361.1 cation-transporting P-type ATPase [Alphaproteobacteria bacterium]MBV1722829.1 cation-transporting P-type ATPase [Hoeflea sp.]MBV1761551.1 cation-transporting P-type ATPase [Hoeflea sp.]
MVQTKLEGAHTRTVQDVAERLGTDAAAGLDPVRAAERLKTHGPNRLRRQKTKSVLSILAHQFQSVIVWLLAAAALMSFALGDLAEGTAIVVVLILNGGIGFFTEISAARSMEALMRIADVKTRVRRGGQERMIDAHGLVPGDVVILDAGDMVTADLRIVKASNLQADESVLTGESLPVTKSAGAVSADAGLGDRFSMAFKGTAITQGSGEALVVATGMVTEIGRISNLVQNAESEVAPLERRLDRLGHRLVWLTFGLAALTIGAGILRGHDLVAMIQTGVALAVAAVPEGLPVVATLSLARGMWRMSQRNAVITRLSSVETLGATTVILTDKTGTLTENRMTAVRYLLDGGEAGLEGHESERHFVNAAAANPLDPATGDALMWAIRIGGLCTNAALGDGSKEARTGDPMELALLQVAATAGLTHASLLETYPEIREHAFDPVAKMMATVHADGDQYLVAVKGAPEAVIDSATQVLGQGGTRPLEKAAREAWKERSAKAAQEGLRLLGLAMKHSGQDDDEPYAGLTLVGLVCLVDPVREDVPPAIAASLAAGVRVIMVTGDHAGTAEAIAREAGLGDGQLTVIEGRDLAGIDADTVSDEVRDRVLGADVFARVAPETKLTLVSIYQQAGHVVAMTGDGVNDAPALKKADIGIAMGKRGTQVAQEAAHMVLRDDKFATIIMAMRQGRVIFDNIRKFVVYLMSCNVSEVLVVGLAVGVGLPIPLLPLQILFLNLVTDVFPAFALGLGKGDGNVMRKPPRNPKESILDRSRWTQIGVLGTAITIATLGAFLLSLSWLKLDSAASVTVAFLTLALAQLWNVFNMRDPDAGLFDNDVTRNPYVWGALALCLGLIGLALWLPQLADLLGLPDPGSQGLALAFVASLTPLALGQLWLALIRFGRA